MTTTPRRLLYFADPMCSWCWGFSPVISAIADRVAGDVALLLVLGGLSPGETRPLGEDARGSIREHWEHVHEASGQPFDPDFFARERFVYDTEPASRAVVAARRLDDSAALPFLAAVQRAFYAENRDVTDLGVLGDIAETEGFERDAFESELRSAAAHHDTQRDFGFSQLLGVRGFPTLVGHDGQSMHLLTRGFQPFEALEESLAPWLG